MHNTPCMHLFIIFYITLCGFACSATIIKTQRISHQQSETGLCLYFILKCTLSCVPAFGLILDQHCSGSVHNGLSVPFMKYWSFKDKAQSDSETITDWFKRDS